MKFAKKIIAYFLVVALALANINIVITEKVSADTITTSGFIKADGRVLKTNYGNGDTIYLRGTNAGGYMLQEFWMCPTNYSDNVSDQMDILNKLTERFGSDSAKTLVQTYEANYWTESDFDICASLGMNCIRLPIWYRNLVDENNNWYSDAFNRIDWFVQKAGERGIYVIIDMHGAYGSQNGSDHSGVDGGDNKLGVSEFFFGSNAASNQEKYYQMWEKIAEHFKGNPIVAGYDLLNEPYCTYRYNSGYSDDYLHSLLWGIYDNAYDRIRAIDNDHLIIMEATWDSWDLPNPNDYGWSNVMYEYHQYEYSDYDNASGTQITSMQNKINNIFAMNYDVPSYLGEFSLFNNISAWEQGLQLLNNNGLNWTTWSYKCVSEYGNWGIVNQSIDKVNVESDSYDTILAKWSNVGSSYLNTNLANTVKSYTPGTATTGSTKMPDEGKYYITCNEKIVCAENEGSDPLIANRDSYSGAWETLYVINNGDGTISLKSDINGKYVCAVIDENCQLLARSETIGTWEKFYPVHIQDNQYGLRAYANNKFVKADFDDETNNGQLKAVSDSVAGAWEAFTFYMVSDATETTTAAQETTTVAANIPSGYTAANTDWNNFNYWSLYFAPNWGNNPTGSYKDGGSYSNFGVYVDKASGTEWGIQLKTQVLSTTIGKTYTCKVSATFNSDMTDTITFKDEGTQVSQIYTLVNGTNDFEIKFTPTADNTQIFIDLGKVPSGGNFVITSFSLEEKEEPTTRTFDAFSTIEAEQFASNQGGVIDTNSSASGGYNIGGVSNGVYMTYENVNFSENAGAIEFCYSSPTGTALGNAEIYVDSLDNKVGTVALTNNGSSWSEYGNITGNLDNEISAGSHTIYVKYVTTGDAYYVANVDYFKFIKLSEVATEAPTTEQLTTEEPTTEETTTEEPTTVVVNTIDGGIEINGYQISASVGGMRTVYSVDSTINGKDVVSSGIIYSLSDYAAEADLYVGSTSAYVKNYASTSVGVSDTLFTDSDIATSYAMTMKFAAGTAAEYNTGWRIRAYAQLSDGTYVYTNAYTYKIYDIADTLYQRCMMNTLANHKYLYNDILTIVDSNYSEVDYNWNNAVITP